MVPGHPSSGAAQTVQVLLVPWAVRSTLEPQPPAGVRRAEAGVCQRKPKESSRPSCCAADGDKGGLVGSDFEPSLTFRT